MALKAASSTTPATPLGEEVRHLRRENAQLKVSNNDGRSTFHDRYPEACNECMLKSKQCVASLWTLAGVALKQAGRGLKVILLLALFIVPSF